MSEQNDELKRLENEDDQETSLMLHKFYGDAKARIRFVSYQGELWYSVVDVIGLLTDAPKPRMYWADMKRTIQGEGFRELLENIQQLRMVATDGKMRVTDAANEQTLLRIIQSIPSPRAEPFKQWLAQVGHAYLEENRQRLSADEADRRRQEYEALGYSDKWINARLQGIVIRDELTDEWRERGVQDGIEVAILTDTLSDGTFDITTGRHRKVKNIGPRHKPRDSYTRMETLLMGIAEETSIGLHQAHDSQGFDELQSDAREAGEVAGNTRREYEARTGRKVVSSENYKTLRQARQRELQAPLFSDEESDTAPEE